jgi:hypothetical protein
MMEYSKIDPVISSWAKEYGLHVGTKYKGEDIRSITIVDDSGNTYGVWISEPDKDNRITVGAASRSNTNEKINLKVTVSELSTALVDVYNRVISWIESSGNTRTPVL